MDKASVLAAVQARVRGALGATLGLQECLAVSLAAACQRDSDAVLGFLLNLAEQRALGGNEKALALGDAEFAALFGPSAAGAQSRSLDTVSRDPCFQEHARIIASALRCSLDEPAARAAWQRGASRAACYLALHTDYAEERIASVLGGLVGADSRRLDDARSVLEEEGTNELLLTQCILALADCVAGSR